MAKLELTVSSDALASIQTMNNLKESVQETADSTTKLRTGFDSAAKSAAELNKELLFEKNNLASLKQALDNSNQALKQTEGLNKQQIAGLKQNVAFNKQAVDAAKVRTQALESQLAVLKKLEAEDKLREENFKKEAAGIAGLRKEYKDLIAAYLSAEKAGDKALSEKLFLRAAKIKDQISDIGAATRAIGTETFAFDALNQGAQTVAASFQIAIGAQALFGAESEDTQKVLVRLNAIMAVTNGLQQISNALQAESAFAMGISKVATFSYATAQAALGKAFNTSSAGARAFSAAISTNAVGALILIITTIITFRKQILEFFTELPQKFGALGRLFQVLLVVISGPLAPLTALIIGIDKLFSSGKKTTESLIEGIKKVTEETQNAVDAQLESINRRYGTEIQLLQIKGQITTELEKEQQQAIIRTLQLQNQQLQVAIKQTEVAKVFSSEFKALNEQLKDQLADNQSLIADAEAQITLTTAQGAKERAEIYKQEYEKRKQEYEAARDIIVGLERRASDTELESLNSDERINALRARGERELDAIKNQFQKANETIAKLTDDQALAELAQRGALTERQYEVLGILRKKLEDDLADEQLKNARDRQQLQIDLLAEGGEKEIAQLKLNFQKRQDQIVEQFGTESQEYLDFTEQRGRAISELQGKLDNERLSQAERIALQEVELLQLSGMSEEEATRYKEQKKMEILLEFAQDRLNLMQNIAAANGEITADEIEQINNLKIAVQNAQGELDASLDKVTDSFESFKKDMENLGLAGAITKAIFPNLGDEEIKAIVGSVQQAYDAIIQIVTDALDASIEANQQIIDNLNQKIEETQNNIHAELELNEQGLANNLDAEKASLAQLQAERQKAFEEQKKLAKQKEALETVQQAISLISASASIFANLAPIPFVGIPLAIAAIGAMIAAFIATKASAKSASGYKDGVIDLQGPGTSKSDSIPANLSKGESVMTAKETDQYGDLFRAIRSGVPAQVQAEMLRQLLENTGVSLPEASEFRNRFMSSGKVSGVAVVTSDNKRLEKELKKSNQVLTKIESNTQDEKVLLTNRGTLISGRGKTKHIIKR